ncbi:hypothetical protein GLOIN_2v1879451 [Rhizophagus irregularis DAOM 181602=DAOM 197198]|uniref:3CxxC-type domain-containing protein n=1 Tax=Rhizophagus irregularis (strain DAOM 181602 / DAOM 197198 / MUCL 43194) TaxID=747089 RepID=A0A2P4PNJ0_RHIID|nr:hypothetical protein GLOIN_2v1879451 [Rhizophagus irregularis DAOM 181602=DAOM 197198]POG66956.1 hypothetical protein GLOIN_2v1879451 [Rhizophagus irregularis DAOM 181602=DAOM 197198]CAG8681934.1 19899_t:CDS:2 [Rhizophagus irregularis]|eukprot:XP_025173822.1 hypothetical protein GLOIN_2v1879451 [Rhizophagus irregularis DAOM 181602=DAOM 197198]
MENIFNNKEVSVKWDENCGKRGNENAEKELFLQIPIMRIRKRSEEREREEQQQKDPTIEITRHLEWNNHYRVFGNWKCLNCQNRWSSAYTWVSLQKFIEQKHLVQGDFFMQNCKKCKKNNNDNCTISNYKPLELSDSEKPHIRKLCAKCQHGATCRHLPELRSEYFSI